MRPVWPCLLLVLLFVVGLSQAQYIRCFVQDYEMIEINGNPNEIAYGAEVDVLNAMPLMLSFDDVSLSAVLSDGCPAKARRDAIQFFWSDRPDFAAPFAAYPVHCDDRKPLTFGISTVSQNHWGTHARNVRDGTSFRPQLGRASMLSGVYTSRQDTLRHRYLMVRMRSLRLYERKLRLRSCVRTEDVPYSMPEGAYEVSVPQLLPIAECVFESGGWCSTQLGYINSAGGQLHIPYGSKANRLLPSNMENGFSMPAYFEEGIHMPSSFEPRLHAVWPCNNVEEPEHAEWRLDGMMLYLENKDWLCNDALSVNAFDQGVDTEAEDKRYLSWYQAKPYVHKKLKTLRARRKVLELDYHLATAHWAKAGVSDAQYSTVARDAHARIVELARATGRLNKTDV